MNTKEIVIHCSDSGFGDASAIEKWHKERGWREIGYHVVILNGCRRRSRNKPNDADYFPADDGIVEYTNRDFSEVGAHVRGYNKDRLGICMIGQHGHYTFSQMESLVKLLDLLLTQYNLQPEHVKGHYEYPTADGKTCPDIHMPSFRKFLNTWRLGS